MYKPKHFILAEFVCKHVYKKYGQTAWQFLDPRLLITMDWIREKLNRKITVNTWMWEGDFTQRGLRCNLCDLVKSRTYQGKVYMSAHPLGQGCDFDIEGMTAGEVRVWLIEHQEELPYPIRIESMVSWIHLDVRDTGSQVYMFTPN